MITNSALPTASLRRLAALAALAIGTAVFLGWQAGEVAVPTDLTPARRTKWVLPARPADDAAKDLAALMERKPWGSTFGGMAAAATAAPNAASQLPQWRLAGIVDRPDGKFALIAIGQPGTTKFEYRAPGDKLPDGNTLVELSNDSATIKADDPNGKTQVLWLFRGGLSSPPPETKPAAAPESHRASLPPSQMTARIDPPVRRAARIANRGQQISR